MRRGRVYELGCDCHSSDDCILGVCDLAICAWASGGLIPTLLGGDLLQGFSLGWVVNGSEDFMGFRGLIFGVASVLFLTGLGVFLGIASYRRRYWRHQAAIAITLGAIFVIGWIVVPTLGKAATLRRQKADIAANTAATAQAIALVATVCQQVAVHLTWKR